ncbi:MAG: SUKH-4 family immunity protein [Zavarzinella sp.]
MNETKWEASALANSNINESDAEYLATHGLPNLKHDNLEFAVDQLGTQPEGTDCHQVGTYGILNDVPLYVRESTAGVWSIDEDSNEFILVNSSVRSFAQFVSLRERYLLDMNKLLPAKVQEQFVLAIKAAMEDIDSAAFGESSLWGPFIDDICNQVAFYEEEF